MTDRRQQKFLGTLNFTFMADYLGDRSELTRKLHKKIMDDPGLIVEFIKGENGFHLELMPMEE